MNTMQTQLTDQEMKEILPILYKRVLPLFDTGDHQFFGCLDNDLDRGLFLMCKEKGVTESAYEKRDTPELLTDEEKVFVQICKSVFKERSPEQTLRDNGLIVR